MKTGSSPPRRRRPPDVAAAEILDAAADLLGRRPFRDLSVDEVMAGTTLSRSSFYVYFRDRYDLLLRLVGNIGDEIYAVADRWFTGGGDPALSVREAVAGVAETYARHGLVMRAVADAAAADPAVEQVYGALIERFVAATVRRIRREQRAGRVLALDPHETARALVWMTERYLIGSLGAAPPRVPVETVIGTLSTIWYRALYKPGAGEIPQ